MERTDVSLGDLTSSSGNKSLSSSSGQFKDTCMFVKEEDLGTYFEEDEGSAQVSLDFCASFEDKEDSHCSGQESIKTEMNKGADEFDEIGNSSQEPSFFSVADSEPSISECDKGDTLQGGPLALTSGGPFSCTYCTASFQTKQLLKQHAVIHSNEKPLSCTQCSSTFKSRRGLRYHSTTHSDERPLRCALCTSSFKNKETLKQHSLVHLGKKPFVCTRCPARFARKDNLKVHLAVHSDKKPFICAHCPARFTLKSTLKRHLDVHFGKKPFFCFHCQIRFSRKDNLKAHLALDLCAGFMA